MYLSAPQGYLLITHQRKAIQTARTGYVLTKTIPTHAPETYARIAGSLYLVIAVFGAFSIAYVPSVIIAAGDAAATAANLLAHRAVFSLGVFADFVVMLSEIVLTVLLYVLFKPVSPTLSLIAMVARLLMVVVMAFNLLINLTPMLLLSGADYLSAFSPPQLQATAYLFTQAHGYGVYIWDVFFGFHLLILGYLVMQSGYFPKLLGAGMLIGSFGYLLEGLSKLTFFDNAALAMTVVGLLVLVSISETSFALWLLIKGLDVTGWTKSLAARAAA